MIINHEHKFIFIGIPKTASTAVHIGWNILKHPPPNEYHMGLNEVLNKNPECKDYFKFCFVRNPYHRFISSWFDLASPHSGHLKQEWNDLDEYTSFEDFYSNFLDSKWIKWVHFLPQYSFCYVDGINKMDFIGRQENFDEDFSEACKLIGIQRPVTERVRFSKKPKSNKELLTKELQDVIDKFYDKDFKEFKYKKETA